MVQSLGLWNSHTKESNWLWLLSMLCIIGLGFFGVLRTVLKF